VACNGRHLIAYEFTDDVGINQPALNIQGKPYVHRRAYGAIPIGSWQALLSWSHESMSQN